MHSGNDVVLCFLARQLPRVATTLVAIAAAVTYRSMLAWIGWGWG
jgi:hypothetical protein